MNDIVFKRVAPDESRIYLDGDHVGDVYAHDDILHPGRRAFIVHLGEDPRGPVRGRDRAPDPRGRAPTPALASAVGLTGRGAVIATGAAGGAAFRRTSGRSTLQSPLRCDFPLRSLSPPLAGSLRAPCTFPGCFALQ